jgi:xylan 1,4-beta-xylosidase
METACRRARGVPVYYTEWNCSSNCHYPPQDEEYAAAFVVKTVMECAPLVNAYSFWTFSDLFEEDYFPSVPFHGGFGLLNIHGIPKPNYWAFALLHALGEERLEVEGQHRTVDAWAIRKGADVTVLLTNHALPRQPIDSVHVAVEMKGWHRPRSCTIQRIDVEHANSKRVWEQFGRPEYLRPEHVREIADASQLFVEQQTWRTTGDGIAFDIALAPHAVAAVTIRT